MREEGVEERRKTERSKDVYETTSVTFSLELRNRKKYLSLELCDKQIQAKYHEYFDFENSRFANTCRKWAGYELKSTKCLIDCQLQASLFFKKNP